MYDSFMVVNSYLSPDLYFWANLTQMETPSSTFSKVPGVRKTLDGQERRSRRLGVKKEQLESGEYYKSEQKILVELSEDKDVKPIVSESIVDECDEILNHFNS